MLTAFGVGEVGDLGERRARELGPLDHTVRDVGRSHPRPVPRAGRLSRRRARPLRDRLGRRTRSATPTSSSSPAGSGSHRCRGAIWTLADRLGAGGGRALRRHRRPLARQVVFADDLAAWREAGADGGADGRCGGSRMERAGRPRHDVARRRWPSTPARTVAMRVRAGDHDALRRPRPPRPRRRPGTIRVSLERNMQCGVGLCGHCQLGPAPRLPGRSGGRLPPRAAS